MSKIRGKSALASHHHNDTKVNGKSYAPPTASLLKIEPFVPTLTSRFRKPFHRSYSTLSTTYLKRTIETKTRSSRHAEKNLLTRQRSRSSLSSSLSSQNGVCRINRQQKEQEKLPDRINYDRRGLTAIPVFENEKNLRLLSLQHNLINVFHVPGHATATLQAKQSQSLIVEEEDEANSSTEEAVKQNGESQPLNGVTATIPVLAPIGKESDVIKVQRNGGHIGKRSIVISPAVTPALLPDGLSLQATGTATGTATGPGTGTNQGTSKLSTLNHSNSNNNLIKNSFVQKSVTLHAHQRYSLKKSKSFITNYSKHFGTIKQNLQKCSLLKPSNLSSFSSDCTNSAQDNNHLQQNPQNQQQDIETEKDVKGLKVKNNQLSPFYGNIFQNLVFLDLYDNQIEKISNLDGLKSLTVLLLGKNRITDIAGLSSVKNTLRVLDLHGNRVSNLSNRINCLQELKSLNLAGNQIRQINQNDFTGLLNLKELNLKRNKIKKVVGFNHLTNLERLWLCHNELQRVEDMSSIAKAIKLQEVSIENNPVSLAGDCVSFLVSYLPNLMMLSQMPITEQVRRAAMAWRKNKEISDSNYSNLTSDVCSSIRREEVISNARTNWELLRSQQILSSAAAKSTSNSNCQQLCLPDGNRFISQDIENGGSVQAKGKSVKHKQDEKNINKSESDLQELFRLPPILKPFANSNPSSEKTHSSGSSLGPNIDSSSSCFSSDTEEKEQHNGYDAIAIRVPQVNEQPALECEDVFYNIVPQDKYKEVRVVEERANPETLSNLSTSNNDISSAVGKDGANQLDDGKGSKGKNSGTDSASVSDKNSNLSTLSLRSESEMSSTAVALIDKPTKTRGPAVTKRYMQGSLMRSQTAKPRTSAFANSNTSNASSNNANNNSNGNHNASKAQKPVVEREREQGGDYLIEICGRYLNIYGLGALRFIDKQWNPQKASDVRTLNFSYINFNSITSTLCRIKFRFPNAESFVFRETNINSLGQLNALAELQGVTSLVIDPEGNSIYGRNWRLYTIYRLSHWGLKTINGVEITDTEVELAQAEYSGLSDLVLWSLPEVLLQPLLTRLRLDENCQASKLSAKEWLMKADQSLKVVVGKEALQWKRAANPHEDLSTRDRGKMHFALMIENTCNAVEKLHQLEILWPNILLDIIKNTLLDYSQLDVYLKDLMSEVMK